MGSLVPGWDAESGVPRDLQPDDIYNIDMEPEREGYFARLRSHRHSKGGVEDFPSSLARISAPESFARSATLGSGMQAKPSLPVRSSTMAHSGSPAAGKASKDPHKYQSTDWSQELTTLQDKGVLRRRSTGASHAPGFVVEDKHGAAWWRALEVGHLNEHPDATPNGDHSTSTFVPQFIHTHELDFGAKDKAQVEEGQK